MKTHFVSGHLDLTLEEFRLFYAGPILEAALEGDAFVVGDARGADCMAQKFLASIGAQATVYHMMESPRNNEGFPAIGGFRSDDGRDRAMTAASDCDIAWVRPGRGNSGTAKNIERRKRTNAGPGKT